MTTAEKRADLQSRGEPWPDCSCHGEPAYWQKGDKYTGGGIFYCGVTRRERQKAKRDERRAAGVCIACGAEPDTETLCRPCADKHADKMAAPDQRWRHQLAHLRWKRRQTDFQPTGVGQAAITAAMTKEGKHG